MDLHRQIDGYCERLDLTFWAEPINAVTNLAFMIAAVIMWRRTGGMPLARALCVILFLIGVGSALFHTFATIWAVNADVIPILVFVLVYLYGILTAYFGLSKWWGLAGVVLFFPYAAATVPLFNWMGIFGSSASYMPIWLGIALFGLILSQSKPEVGKGMLIGAAILGVSITFRTIDEPLCHAIPHGTHFLWHFLNGIMLGWMIEVYRRHRLAAPAAQG